jgi:hypothetical protein
MSTLARGLTATGTSSQAAAFPIVAENNIFTTVAANSGARLPIGLNSHRIFRIRNAGANALLVYPPPGGRINGNSINSAFSQSAGFSFSFIEDPYDPFSFWVI